MYSVYRVRYGIETLVATFVYAQEACDYANKNNLIASNNYHGTLEIDFVVKNEEEDLINNYKKYNDLYGDQLEIYPDGNKENTYFLVSSDDDIQCVLSFTREQLEEIADYIKGLS